MRRLTRAALLATWPLVFGVAACSSDSSTEPIPPEATSLSIVSGDEQVLESGEASEALTVQVLDQNGDPMAGVTVTFTGSGVEHTLSAQSQSTGSNGQASITATAGSAEGAFEVEAGVSGLQSVTFSLDVEISIEATTLVKIEGDEQTLDLNEESAPLVVEVLDQNDDPLAGVTVTFTGSGADHELSAESVETDNDGRAEITVTAGTEEGEIEVEAEVEGLDAVVFTLTVEEVIVPTTLNIISGDGQSFDFNEESDPLVVEVLDQNDDPMEGVTVVFSASGVTHSRSDESVQTGADGLAEITVTAGTVDGEIEVEASVDGAGSVAFALEVRDGPFSIPAPDNALGTAWDGTFLWVVAGPDANPVIHRIDPTDGSIEQSFDAPAGDHRGLTWDGEALWYSSDDTDRIYQLDPSDGSVLNDFAAPGDGPRGLAWDGTSLWHNDHTGGTGTVYRLFPENGAILGSFSSPASGSPLGLAWDGSHFWTTQAAGGVVADRTIIRFDDTGAVDTSIPNPGTFPIGLAFDPAGSWIWAADNEEDVFHRVKVDLDP